MSNTHSDYTRPGVEPWWDHRDQPLPLEGLDDEEGRILPRLRASLAETPPWDEEKAS